MMKLLGKKLFNKKGFSLTELIIVIAIMGVLAAVAGPAIFKYLKDSKIKADRASAKQIQSAVEAVIINNTQYLDPATGNLLVNSNDSSGSPAIADLNTISPKPGYKDFIDKVRDSLSGNKFPKTAQANGHYFYIYRSKANGYKVVCFNPTEQTKGASTTDADRLAHLQEEFPDLAAGSVPVDGQTSSINSDADWGKAAYKLEDNGIGYTSP